MRATLPRATAWPPTRATTPLPVTERKSSAATGLMPRASAPSTMAAASGCSLPTSTLAARRSTSPSSASATGTTARRRGRPSVSVPVLSTTRVSTFSRISSASALRMSTPASAPRPVPTTTRLPGVFSTGIDSPVTSDSSTALRPSSTTPSTGTFSPGRTRSRSPTCTCSRHVLLGAVGPEPACRRGRQAEQRPDRATRLAARAQLEHLAQQHEDRDDGCGLEVEPDLAAVRAERRREEPGRERPDDTVDVRHPGAERDQREHVEAAVDDRRPAPLEEGPARPQDHRRRQHEL